QVRVERTDAKGRPTILTTSRMTVWPEKDYAETKQAVRIDAANGVTTATGMKAYPNDGRMHLLSNVRGKHELRYDPPPPARFERIVAWYHCLGATRRPRTADSRTGRFGRTGRPARRGSLSWRRRHYAGHDEDHRRYGDHHPGS